ncbi:hypothetical protein T439DRAFT_339052 [Meredithblackwellia eburnea MCA 4105]
MPHQGSCLCGQSTVKVASTHDGQIACHCTDCQRTAGAAFSTNILAKISDVEISGPAVKEYGAKADSGNIVTRVYCGNCGSALGHKSKVFGDAMAVQTGNLPDFKTIKFDAELFTRSRFTGIPPIPGAAQKETM